MEKIQLLSYQSTYPGLNKKLFEEQPETYKKALLRVRANELAKMGTKMRRANKPNAKGTKITFEALRSDEEVIAEASKINKECVECGMTELLEKVN